MYSIKAPQYCIFFLSLALLPINNLTFQVGVAHFMDLRDFVNILVYVFRLDSVFALAQLLFFSRYLGGDRIDLSGQCRNDGTDIVVVVITRISSREQFGGGCFTSTWKPTVQCV